MTKGELNILEKRVYEIDAILDLCSDWDRDVTDNLITELDSIILQLETNLKLRLV